MKVHAIVFTFAMLASGVSFAAACDVHTRSQSASVPSVESHTCYRFTGVDEDTIDWSCSNESKDMLSTEKRRVRACQDNSVGSCTATLTQESLANPHSTSKAPQRDTLAIPEGAQVVTYYYATAHLQQARKDCESAGGRWQDQ
ncbi:hypothetical protein D3C77_239520 [compost metagenome]